MSVITISRQFGAGGKTLGTMISKKLGYAFFDNEIIQMVAKEAKVSTDWVGSLEKEAGGKFQRFVSSMMPKSVLDRVLDERGYIDEEIYVDMLYEIINRVADEGGAVILGRGSQYILKDREDACHILLIGEKEDRVKFMEVHYKMTNKQAVQIVEAEDKRRLNLYRSFGKTDYDSPSLYHITLNMSMLTLENACELVCRLASLHLNIPESSAGMMEKVWE